MPARGLLQWIEGAGWLVFSGGDVAGSPLRAQALARTAVDGGALYISLADDAGEALQDDLEDLGAPAGYVLDLTLETPTAIATQLEAAALIVIETGDSLNPLVQALQGAVVDGLRAAYERGAVILLEGLAVNVFGRWAMSDSGHLVAGLDWLPNAFIEPGVTAASESRAVQAVLEQLPEAIAIEIGSGSALALGAAGEVETWGARQVTISLGRKYQEA